MDYGDIPDPYLHRYISVGFLVSENAKAKIVVPTIADVEHPACTDGCTVYPPQLNLSGPASTNATCVPQTPR
jgi:hypothetical protein